MYICGWGARPVTDGLFLPTRWPVLPEVHLVPVARLGKAASLGKITRCWLTVLKSVRICYIVNSEDKGGRSSRRPSELGGRHHNPEWCGSNLHRCIL